MDSNQPFGAFVPSLQAQPWIPGAKAIPTATPNSETQSVRSALPSSDASTVSGMSGMMGTSMSQASFDGSSWAADDNDFLDSMLDLAGKKKANQRNKANQWKQTKSKGTSPALKPAGAPTTIASVGRFEALQPSSYRGNATTRANFGSWRK